jgi:hypothetical protein
MAKPRKEGEEAVHFTFVMPRPLYSRMIKQAAKETADTESRVSPGEICRAALEEYLDLYEGAAFEKKEGVR